MSITRSRNGTAVATVRRSFSQSTPRPPSGPVLRCRAKLMEPRLQTAVSVSVDTSVISVHRLDRCTTFPASPVWLHRALDASLNVIQPFPVWASVRIIFPYRSRAFTCRTYRPSASAAR